MPVIVPVMFLCFQGFLNHNKLSVMPPRSMAFFIFNSIHPVQELLLSIPVPPSMKMFNLWLSPDWWEELNESRNSKIGEFRTIGLTP
ncbi:hypothetical protein HanLR1_Chr16g0614511 [Helianthus annuus]|nr:hypothetical protein HanLR1_Chr16g0614511 [Helianthus annuus]